MMKVSTPQSEFWEWFEANQSEFPVTEEFHDAYGQELYERLNRVHQDLAYEILIPGEGEKGLIISADGVRNTIPHVEELVQAAPKVEGWRFTAFRPRMDDYTRFTLRFQDIEFNPEELWCYS